VVLAEAAFTGGLSYDNNFLCGGGGLVAMLDLSKGTSIADTVGPWLYNTPNSLSNQACNASISSSRSTKGFMSYLDFGSFGKKNSLVNEGKAWGKWQIIFMADAQGNKGKTFVYPKTYEVPLQTYGSNSAPCGGSSPWDDSSLVGTKWHHSEWTNHPYYMTAVVATERSFCVNGSWKNNTDFEERIYTINLKDSTYLELVRPKDAPLYATSKFATLWPTMWVEVPENFVEAEDWIAVGIRRNNNARNSNVFLQGNTLVSGHYLDQVNLLTLDGKLIRRYDLNQPALRVELNSHLESGAYLLEAKSKGQRVGVVTYSVMR
jgi:hypothetical protein